MKNPFKIAKIFIPEMIGELRKASWPNRKELCESTFIVIIGIAILGAYISIVDFSLFQVVQLFSSWVQFGISG